MRSAVGWWSSCKLCSLVVDSTGHRPGQAYSHFGSKLILHRRTFPPFTSAGIMPSVMNAQHREAGFFAKTPWQACLNSDPSTITPVSDVDQAEAASTDSSQGRMKKKVAFWVGYVGTEYKGLQLQRSPGIPTVEAELERAILKADGMLGSNFGDLHRLGWARSSRTDKGVHSVSTVISMKMEVPEGAWSHDEDGIALAQSINAYLPPSIRVFSVVPVPRSFEARKMCYTRTYEYLLPAGVLELEHPGLAATAEGRIAELNSILSAFQGRHPFHNYTVRSRYQDVDPKPVYLSRQSVFGGVYEPPAAVRSSDDDVAHPVLAEDCISSARDDENDTFPVGTGEADAGNPAVSEPRARWIFEPEVKDKVRSAHFRHILSCSCSSHLESCGNARFLRISITGESFMLHQIRKIVGTSVAVLWGVLPRDVIPLSLARHSRIVLPLAPSEGLILVDNEFHPFRQPSSYAQSLISLMGSEKQPRLEASGRVKKDMQVFVRDVLLPSIAPLLEDSAPVWSSWITNVTRDGQIAEEELDPVRHAFANWVEHNSLQKDIRRQELEQMTGPSP